MSESVRVFAPATVANLGPGFDILGMAITEPGDTVTAYRIDQPEIVIDKITGDNGKLPLDSRKNTAGIAAEFVRRQIAPEQGARLRIEKGLPLSSGLGSSAASAVAAAFAINALFGNPLPVLELIPALLEAEAAVSGRHLDNVAPCLLGGIVLSAGLTVRDVHQLPIGPVLRQQATFVMITPHAELPTVESRRILPTAVPFRTMVKQSAAVARLVHAIHVDDLFLFADAMNDEQVVHAARAALIDGYDAIVDMCTRAGALSIIISGGGPTLMALCPDTQSADTVVDYVHGLGIPLTTRVSGLCMEGARLM